MPVDIDHLTYDELVALNHRVVERLNWLETMHVHPAMLTVDLGARVSLVKQR